MCPRFEWHLNTRPKVRLIIRPGSWQGPFKIGTLKRPVLRGLWMTCIQMIIVATSKRTKFCVNACPFWALFYLFGTHTVYWYCMNELSVYESLFGFSLFSLLTFFSVFETWKRFISTSTKYIVNVTHTKCVSQWLLKLPPKYMSNVAKSWQ